MTQELLAKSNCESLFLHTWKVVEAVRQVVDNLPYGIYDLDVLRKELELSAAFHDVGKAATGFQEVLHRERKDWGGKRHEVISTAFAAHSSELSEEAQIAILTHHRTLPVDGTAGKEKAAIPSEQMPDEETAVWADMTSEFDANRVPFADFWKQVCEKIGRPDLIALATSALAGFKFHPAWAKQSPANKFGQLQTFSFERRHRAALYRGLLVTADHMASGHTLPKPFPDLRQATIYKGELRAFQEKCRDTKQNAILRAPTGSGKTESSLLWMQGNWRKNSRVFYVLPYTASINAMHKRLENIFGKENVNVLHGKASSYLYSLRGEDEKPLDAQAKAANLAQLSKEMYFPIRVCTPHQILRYALRGRGWEQMLGEFPQACFIFDEIHAYDAHLTGLILGAAKMATKWDARMLFASATMPRFLMQLIQETLGISTDQIITPNPKKETDREVLEKKRHEVEIWEGNLLSRLDEILPLVENCSSTLIVCNHVRTALQVFDRCEQKFGTGAVLLHSRFVPRDRNRIETDLLNKPLPRVFVATQVVEVSLNIDFYQGFLEPAPIDAEAQRMGRINRYGARPPALVVIMDEQVHSHKLYDADKSQRTIDILRNIENPVSEDVLVEIANQVYGEGYQGEQKLQFEAALHLESFEALETQLIAGTHRDWVDDVFDKEDERIEVLPSYYEKEHNAAVEAGNWLEAKSMLVSLPFSMVDRLRKDPKHWRSIEVYENQPWVVHKPYDAIRGLQLDATENERD